MGFCRYDPTVKTMKKVIVNIFSLVLVLSLCNLAAGQAGSSSLNDQLLQVAIQGDTTLVQQLLDKGANIEARN
jgi:sensor domain CHASE-containing protein